MRGTQVCTHVKIHLSVGLGLGFLAHFTVCISHTIKKPVKPYIYDQCAYICILHLNLNVKCRRFGVCSEGNGEPFRVQARGGQQ